MVSNISCLCTNIDSTNLLYLARSDDCRTIQFRPETKNKFLENHMIRSMTVPSKSLCESQCYQEPNCVSYNYGPMHSDTPACDLNIGTHLQASSEDFILKDDYTYRDILVWNKVESFMSLFLLIIFLSLSSFWVYFHFLLPFSFFLFFFFFDKSNCLESLSKQSLPG